MLFAITAAALTGVVALSILRPFLRAGAPAAEPAAAFDLRVYRDQLAEVDRDLARGVIGADDAERLRTEIGRKLLDADRRLHAAAPDRAARGRARPVAAALVLAVLAGGAVAVYARLGAPGQDDMPLATRIAAAQDAYAGRPAQAEAEATALPVVVPEPPDAEYAALIARLRAAVADRPDDPRGLALLARNEARLSNMVAARQAQQRLVDLRGPDATATEHAELAALMVQAAGGLVTAEAEAQIARALQKDPRHPQARYMQGLLFAQNGRPDQTFPLWSALLADGPEDAPWIAPIRGAIGDLAWLAGQPDYVPPEPAAGPALDDAALAEARAAAPDVRPALIGERVARLEGRLASDGGTPEDWARLIAGLALIGQDARAALIWAEAQTRFAPFPDALALVRAAAEGAGVDVAATPPLAATPAAPPAAPPSGAMPGPDADAVAAAEAMPPEARQAMIAGMVDRLRTRLATEGGSAEEWARLIAVLATTGDRAAAAKAWTDAQAALAGDPPGLGVARGAAEAAGVAAP